MSDDTKNLYQSSLTMELLRNRQTSTYKAFHSILVFFQSTFPQEHNHFENIIQQSIRRYLKTEQETFISFLLFFISQSDPHFEIDSFPFFKSFLKNRDLLNSKFQISKAAFSFLKQPIPQFISKYQFLLINYSKSREIILTIRSLVLDFTTNFRVIMKKMHSLLKKSFFVYQKFLKFQTKIGETKSNVVSNEVQNNKIREYSFTTCVIFDIEKTNLESSNEFSQNSFALSNPLIQAPQFSGTQSYFSSNIHSNQSSSNINKKEMKTCSYLSKNNDLPLSHFDQIEQLENDLNASKSQINSLKFDLSNVSQKYEQLSKSLNQVISYSSQSDLISKLSLIKQQNENFIQFTKSINCKIDEIPHRIINLQQANKSARDEYEKETEIQKNFVNQIATILAPYNSHLSDKQNITKTKILEGIVSLKATIDQNQKNIEIFKDRYNNLLSKLHNIFKFENESELFYQLDNYNSMNLAKENDLNEIGRIDLSEKNNLDSLYSSVKAQLQTTTSSFLSLKQEYDSFLNSNSVLLHTDKDSQSIIASIKSLLFENQTQKNDLQQLQSIFNELKQRYSIDNINNIVQFIENLRQENSFQKSSNELLSKEFCQLSANHQNLVTGVKQFLTFSSLDEIPDQIFEMSHQLQESNKKYQNLINLHNFFIDKLYSILFQVPSDKQDNNKSEIYSKPFKLSEKEEKIIKDIQNLLNDSVTTKKEVNSFIQSYNAIILPFAASMEVSEKNSYSTLTSDNFAKTIIDQIKQFLLQKTKQEETLNDISQIIRNDFLSNSDHNEQINIIQFLKYIKDEYQKFKKDHDTLSQISDKMNIETSEILTVFSKLNVENQELSLKINEYKSIVTYFKEWIHFDDSSQIPEIIKEISQKLEGFENLRKVFIDSGTNPSNNSPEEMLKIAKETILFAQKAQKIFDGIKNYIGYSDISSIPNDVNNLKGAKEKLEKLVTQLENSNKMNEEIMEKTSKLFSTQKFSDLPNLIEKLKKELDEKNQIISSYLDCIKQLMSYLKLSQNNFDESIYIKKEDFKAKQQMILDKVIQIQEFNETLNKEYSLLRSSTNEKIEEFQEFLNSLTKILKIPTNSQKIFIIDTVKKFLERYNFISNQNISIMDSHNQMISRLSQVISFSNEEDIPEIFSNLHSSLLLKESQLSAIQEQKLGLEEKVNYLIEEKKKILESIQSLLHTSDIDSALQIIQQNLIEIYNDKIFIKNIQDFLIQLKGLFKDNTPFANDDFLSDSTSKVQRCCNELFKTIKSQKEDRDRSKSDLCKITNEYNDLISNIHKYIQFDSNHLIPHLVQKLVEDNRKNEEEVKTLNKSNEQISNSFLLLQNEHNNLIKEISSIITFDKAEDIPSLISQLKIKSESSISDLTKYSTSFDEFVGKIKMILNECLEHDKIGHGNQSDQNNYSNNSTSLNESPEKTNLEEINKIINSIQKLCKSVSNLKKSADDSGKKYNHLIQILKQSIHFQNEDQIPLFFNNLVKKNETYKNQMKRLEDEYNKKIKVLEDNHKNELLSLSTVLVGKNDQILSVEKLIELYKENEQQKNQCINDLEKGKAKTNRFLEEIRKIEQVILISFSSNFFKKLYIFFLYFRNFNNI